MRTRLLVALYVALALHGLIALGLLLVPASQSGRGAGADLGLGLRLEGDDGVFAVEPRRSTQALGLGGEMPEQGGVTHSSINVDRAENRASAVSEQRPVLDARADGSASSARVGGGGMDSYFAQLRRHLHRFRRELPDHLGFARATVGFEVSADGSLGSVELVQSSGVAFFDEEAVALVRRAAPLPRPPSGEATRLVVPIAIDPP